MSSNNTPKIIKGGVAKDDRGQVVFANDFDLEPVRRFYMIENSSTDIVRAWHGHMKEDKYAFVISGRALLAVVFLDDSVKPSKDNQILKFEMSASKPEILHIPGGYANGWKALEPNTKVMFFSIASLEESEQNDDFRFPEDYWGKEVWKI